jgi:hypothetical protein
LIGRQEKFALLSRSSTAAKLFHSPAAPRLAWKNQTVVNGIRDEVLLSARTPLFDVPLKRAFDRLDVAIACDIGTAQPIG